MPLPRPALGDTLLIACSDGTAFNAPVSSVLGQYIYVGGGRFHVSDNRLGPFTWENNDVVYHLLPDSEKNSSSRENVVPIHSAASASDHVTSEKSVA